MRTIFFKLYGASFPGDWIPGIEGVSVRQGDRVELACFLTYQLETWQTKIPLFSFRIRLFFYIMMKKIIFCALLGWIGLRVSAQEQAFVHEGEYGFNVGASQYFG